MREKKERSYKYACRRDREPVGKLGRMSNGEYYAYIRDKNEDTHHKREYHNKDLKRLSRREYAELRKEIPKKEAFG